MHVSQRAFVVAALSIALLVSSAGAVAAQGVNGRPLPFQPGYFPGYDQPRVVATTADVEVMTDDRPLTIPFPLDRHIVRTIMVRNIRTERVRVEYAATIAIPDYAEEAFINHPQPNYLYLEPGQSHPIRLTYEVGVTPATQTWSVGDRIDAPMSLSLQALRVTSGGGNSVQIALPNVLDVVARDQLPAPASTLPGPAPNATITGSVRSAANQPYANGSLLLGSSWGSMRLQTDANGEFSASVFAYQRGGAASWREFFLAPDGPGTDGVPQRVVVAPAGAGTRVDVVLPAAPLPLDYRVTGSLDLDLQAYDWDASADGSTIATVPFHTGMSPEAVAPLAFVTVFDNSGSLLFRFPLISETPAVDVSDDGTLVATTRTTSVGFTAASAIVLNRSGQIVREVQPQDTPTGWATTVGAYSYVEVRLSHDNRYLAVGDAVGRIALIDMASGNELWRSFPGGQVRFIEFDTNDARIFVSSGDGYLRAYGLDGTVLWRTWVDSWLTAMDVSPRFIVASGKAIRGSLHLIDKVTGATRWSYGVDSRAPSVRIAPDESFVWYGTTSGVMRNVMFSIDGVATLQLSRTGGASAGAISGDSQYIAYKSEIPNQCNLAVSDRLGRSVFSTRLSDCVGTANQMLWMLPDGRRLAVAVGRSTMASGRVYFLTRHVAPTMTATPALLRFGATKAGAGGDLTAVTAAQTVTVAATGAALGSWTAISNQPWLQVAGGSGTGSGRFTASIVNPTNVIGGQSMLTATITITAPDAANSPLTIPVTLTIDQTGGSTVAALGQVDTPVQSATNLVGAIGVTGWVVDDVGISGVKIYRSCLSFENQASCQIVGGQNVVFVGDAAFVPGARPDVESAYSTYPASNVAGWGYLLLTNMLPNVTGSLGFGGQGSLSLYVFATDLDGHVTLLGRTAADHTPTSITMANASIAKPFGAIDTPSQGGTVSGTFPTFGWVLTPDSNTTAETGDILMATNGSSMRVFIDGVSVGNVTYNQCRGNVGNPVAAGVYCNDDVANIFGNATPQPTFTARSANATLFRNLDAGRSAIGSFDVNTSGMTNGMHSIAWGVTDTANRSEGIGSRNFFVLNTGGDSLEVGRDFSPAGGAGAQAPAYLATHAQILGDASSLPETAADARVTGRRGFSLDTPFVDVLANAVGERHVTIGQMDRLELQLGTGIERGYLVANGTLRGLPVGSQLDATTGTFTWAPAPGYLGTYRLVFVSGAGIGAGSLRTDALPMEAGSSDPARTSASAGSKDPASIRITVTIRTPRETPAGDSEIRMFVDAVTSPAAGTVRVVGWALDPDAFTGSGIGAVHVWARRIDVPLSAAEFVGAATLGGARPDVAKAFGASFDQAGYGLTGSLTPGTYEVTVHAWNLRTARWEDARTVTVSVR